MRIEPVFAGILCAFSSLAATGPPSVTFTRDVMPVLQKNCQGCHGPQQQLSGLRLDSRAAALRGGYSGPALIPRNSAGSKMSNAATLTVNAAGAVTPIMFQHIASSTNPAGDGISGHAFVFRTETLPPNTVAVMGVSAPVGITVTISDTLAGSWSAALCSASGAVPANDVKASVFVQPLGATGGTDTITINVGSTNIQPVQFDVTFWQNINTSTPANGSLCTGNITPGAGGLAILAASVDLLWSAG